MRLLCFTKCANIFKLQIYVALLIFITGSRMKIVLLFGSICGPGIKSIIESESHGHNQSGLLIRLQSSTGHSTTPSSLSPSPLFELSVQGDN